MIPQSGNIERRHSDMVDHQRNKKGQMINILDDKEVIFQHEGEIEFFGFDTKAMLDGRNIADELYKFLNSGDQIILTVEKRKVKHHGGQTYNESDQANKSSNGGKEKRDSGDSWW